MQSNLNYESIVVLFLLLISILNFRYIFQKNNSNLLEKKAKTKRTNPVWENVGML